MTYKKNDIATVEITDITDLGFGVGRLGGIVVFVADTVPGDVAKVKIIKVNRSYLVARLESLDEESPLRSPHRCDETACKSCAYKNIRYDHECRLKQEDVRRLFSSSELSGISVAPITPSPSEIRYRNKAQYPISLEGGEYRIGFFAPKSHRVCAVGDCPLTPEVFSRIVAELKRYFSEHALTVYDEGTGTGLLRHIYLRRAEVSGEILLTLVINGDSIPAADRLVQVLVSEFPSLVGILLNINREDTNVVLGDEYVTLWGRDYIVDTLAGVELKISAQSFYQVNHSAAELLYAKARELASPRSTDTLLDLFCGTGSIGLSMADSVGELIGIEIVDSAVRCAEYNAEKNGALNARFFTGDASCTERLLEHAETELGHAISPDIVVLDPPRGGCTEVLIDFVSRLSPRSVVYISCNPRTLARDVSLFRKNGYNTSTVYPFDLFPMTGHCESVCLLTRQNDTASQNTKTEE